MPHETAGGRSPMFRYDSVASILKHRLDQQASPQTADGTPLLHDNIRGSRYFH